MKVYLFALFVLLLVVSTQGYRSPPAKDVRNKNNAAIAKEAAAHKAALALNLPVRANLYCPIELVKKNVAKKVRAIKSKAAKAPKAKKPAKGKKASLLELSAEQPADAPLNAKEEAICKQKHMEYLKALEQGKTLATGAAAKAKKKAYYNVRNSDVDTSVPKSKRGQFAKKKAPAPPKPAAPAAPKNYGDICDRDNQCTGGLTCEFSLGSYSKYCADHYFRPYGTCQSNMADRCPPGTTCTSDGRDHMSCQPSKPAPPAPAPAPKPAAPAAPVKNYGDFCDRDTDCKGGLTCEFLVGSYEKRCGDRLFRAGGTCQSNMMDRCPPGTTCVRDPNDRNRMYCATNPK